MLRALSVLWTFLAAPMGDHLWQSSLFVALAGLLALALRKNQARVRYWVWMTASLKFLIPFSLLITLGSAIAKPRMSTPAQTVVYSAVEDFSQPFAEQEMTVISQAAPSPAPVSHFHLLPPAVIAIWLGGITVVLLGWIKSWIRVLLLVRTAAPLEEGSEADALHGLEARLAVRKPIKLVLSQNWMEPGIFGIVDPVLIWPKGISEHLDDRHIEAILAHEICHACRQDNLTALLHMLVRAIFWFHPLVWWIGGRLEEERERACDEAVTKLCKQPHVYAESILKVCKFCSESPLACVSGITGADLKNRLLHIMRNQAAHKLGLGGTCLLALVGLTTLVVPLMVGQVETSKPLTTSALKQPKVSTLKPSSTISPDLFALSQISQASDPQSPPISNPPARQPSVTAPPINGAALSASQAASAQQPTAQISPASNSETDTAAKYKDLRFDVVSIRRNKSGGPQIFGKVTPDGFEMRNMFLAAAIVTAYVPTTGGAAHYSDDQVVGMESRLTGDDYRYDLDAKVGEADLQDWQNPAKQPAMLRAMLQNMLADRLKLKVHRSTKEERTYALVVARGGPHFKESVPGESHPGAFPFAGGGVMSREAKDGWIMSHFFGISIGQIVSMLSPEGRPAQDKTGLTGKYDVTLVQPEPPGAGTPQAQATPPLSPGERADQLGLKLVPSQGQVETLIIDHVEQPSEN